jgi:membrane-associated phospholipid phosphatase
VMGSLAAVGAAVRRRLPGQLRWMQARLDGGAQRGFPLTIALIFAVLTAWAFGSLTENVMASEEAAKLDPGVLRFFVTNRVEWLTTVMKIVTWLGSSTVVVPAVVLGALYAALRQRRPPVAAALIAVMVGAILVSHLTKAFVDRPRPPQGLFLVHVTGSAYPSGHTEYAVAGWLMLAVVLAHHHSIRARAVMVGGAAFIGAVVGVSRLYLGVHWFTDVLGGAAAGAALVAIAWVILLATRSSSPAPDSDRSPGLVSA